MLQRILFSNVEIFISYPIAGRWLGWGEPLFIAH